MGRKQRPRTEQPELESSLQKNCFKQQCCNHWECGVAECCYTLVGDKKTEAQSYPKCYPCSPPAPPRVAASKTSSKEQQKKKSFSQLESRPSLAGFMFGGESLAGEPREEEKKEDSFMHSVDNHLKNDLPQQLSSSELLKIRVTNMKLIDNTGHSGLFSGVIDRRTNQPNGEGTMVYDNDVVYEGRWVNGDLCGFGRLTDEGDFYQGGFFDNMKHGLGVMKYKDGRIYDGTFQFDKLEGKGHMTNVNDDTKYWGCWNPDGLPHGRGKLEYSDGRIYDGELDCGILQGHGRMTWPSGNWYLGEWCDGIPNGLGIEASEDGALIFEGMYCRGKPIQASSIPYCQKSEGRFLLYRSSVARQGTLIGPLPREVLMRKRRMNWGLQFRP